MDISKAVAERILELCKEHDITLGKLSKQSSMQQSTVIDIVNGITKNAGINTVKRLCDGFNISLVDFFCAPIFDNREKEIK